MALDQSKVHQFRQKALERGYSMQKIDKYLDMRTKTYGEKEEKPGSVTVYEREVRGAIENMKSANEPLGEIHAMIRTRGYKPEDFADLLEGYSPKEEEREKEGGGFGELFRRAGEIGGGIFEKMKGLSRRPYESVWGQP